MPPNGGLIKTRKPNVEKSHQFLEGKESIFFEIYKNNYAN